MKSGILLRRWVRPTTTVAFGAAVMLFWLIGHPEALNYQEQNQLFLFTTDFFACNVKLVGGMADYVSEFLVQFYFLPWLGAVILGFVYSVMQWLLWKAVEKYDVRLFPATFVLPLLMLSYQGDIDVLLSLPVAVIMSLASFVLLRKFCPTPYIDILVVPALYWMAGPVVWIYILLRSLDCGWIYVLVSGVLTVCIVFVAYWILDYQWPLSMMFTGINYYRIPLHEPMMQYIVPLSAVVIAFVAVLTNKYVSQKSRRILWAVEIAVVGIVASIVVDGYDPKVYEMLWQDSMVRQERWNDIIDRAKKHQDDNAFSSECVNLALGVTGQLPDRMFLFNQSGSDALLLHSIRDNMSDLPTAEAFFRLGMVNSALRYMFDIQQSILNFRKSGRCTKRIVECYIVNGNYKAAAKHLELLKHSLFYADWAKDAETYLNNDAKVECHKVWGKLRRLRFKEEFLYSYPEKHKMLGLLFLNNTENRLALAYFMGQLLLDGKFTEFMGYMSWVQQYGGYADIPYGYADAIQAIKNQGNVPGSAYAKYAAKMISKMKNEVNEE